jgi:solute carrier family 45 protein 1/2/4
MTFPSNIDADPDPTTQVTWPASRRLHRDTAAINTPSAESPQVERGSPPLDVGKPVNETLLPGKRRLTTLDLINLSISMGGAQIAWTVELGCVREYSMGPDGSPMLYQIWNPVPALLGVI